MKASNSLVFCRRLASVAAAVLSLVSGPAAAQEQKTAEAARAIIERAIIAHGGPAKLEKLQTSALRFKAKVKVHQMEGGAMTMELWKAGDRGKVVTEVDVNGMAVVSTVVLNGDDFWLNINGMTIEVPEAMRKTIRQKIKEQEARSNELGNLPSLLKKKDIGLDVLGEIQVDGKPAVGVRISAKGQTDANFYFDKETGRLVKGEGRGPDILTNEEKGHESIFRDYKEFDGILVATKMIYKQDGKDFSEMEITEWQLAESFADDVFAKP